MEIKLIAAMDVNGVIGRTTKPCTCLERHGAGQDPHVHWDCQGTYTEPCNDIPWRFPEDMAFFKAETMGHPVIMGRITKESIPAKFFPLPGRENIVVSSTPDGKYVLPSLESALVHAESLGHDTAYVIGGARLYEAALPLATELVLTMIDREYEGDVKFPHWDCFSRTKGLPIDGLRHYGYADGWSFECVERRQGTTPELAFTRWRRR